MSIQGGNPYYARDSIPEQGNNRQAIEKVALELSQKEQLSKELCLKILNTFKSCKMDFNLVQQKLQNSFSQADVNFYYDFYQRNQYIIDSIFSKRSSHSAAKQAMTKKKVDNEELKKIKEYLVSNKIDKFSDERSIDVLINCFALHGYSWKIICDHLFNNKIYVSVTRLKKIVREAKKNVPGYPLAPLTNDFSPEPKSVIEVSDDEKSNDERVPEVYFQGQSTQTYSSHVYDPQNMWSGGNEDYYRPQVSQVPSNITYHQPAVVESASLARNPIRVSAVNKHQIFLENLAQIKHLIIYYNCDWVAVSNGLKSYNINLSAKTIKNLFQKNRHLFAEVGYFPPPSGRTIAPYIIDEYRKVLPLRPPYWNEQLERLVVDLIASYGTSWDVISNELHKQFHLNIPEKDLKLFHKILKSTTRLI